MTEKHSIRVSRVFQIEIERISLNPQHPRKTIDPERLQSLARSIAGNGILQPLCVRATGESLELVSGVRRLKAAVMAGLQSVPCIVIEANERESALWCLLENKQRANMHYFDEAQAVEQLIDRYHMTAEEIASVLGQSKARIEKKLSLLAIPEQMRKIITECKMTERETRQLLQQKDTKSGLISLLEQKMKPSAVCTEMGEQGREPCRKAYFKDLRIFLNTFHHAVEVMQKAGIAAREYIDEYDDHYSFLIVIPK